MTDDGDDPGSETPASSAAFEEVYRTHREAVYRYCLTRLRNPELAEDVCEDVFVSAIRSYRRAPIVDAEVKLWLMRIAHNAVIDHWRRRSRWSRVTTVLHGGEMSAVNVEQSVIDRSALRAVFEAMTGLRSKERELVSLRIGAGLTYAEIAKVVAMSEEGVRTATRRAIAKLQAAADGAE